MNERSLRIGLFIPRLSHGGAQRVLRLVARELGRRGNHVDLLSLELGDTDLREARGVTLQEIDANRAAAALPHLRRYVRDGRPDAILSTLPQADLVLSLATSLSPGEDPAVVHRLANTGIPDSGSNGPVKRRIIQGLCRWRYPKADAVVAVSEGVARHARDDWNVPEDRIAVVPNPVDLEDVQRAIDEPTDVSFLDDGRPTVLGAGRLVPQKGFDVLLEAFSQMRERHGVDAQLVIAGEGPQRSKLEARADELGLADAVCFPGYVDPLLPLMDQADLFVLSSRREGMPNVLLEALACGTPVVSTDCPSGPDQILEGGEVAPLVPVDDPASAAEAMVETLADPPDPKRLRQRAGDFPLSRTVQGYVDVFEDLATNDGGR